MPAQHVEFCSCIRIWSKALALTHDLGYLPFSHVGEQVFRICMAPYSGFDHNTQALCIVTRLKHRHAALDGLNLTWENAGGHGKHNGSLLETQSSGVQLGEINVWPNGTNHESLRDPKPDTWPSLVALADDIVYNSCSLDDELRTDLFTIDEPIEVQAGRGGICHRAGLLYRL